MIKCITFDLDDTLWACAPVIEKAERALYDWLAAHYPLICEDRTVEDLRAHREALRAQRSDLQHDMTALRRRWIAQLAEEAGYPREMVEPAVAYFRHHRNQVTLFEEAESLLKRLRKRYIVGAITNGNAQVDVIGADHLFDFVVYSADAGIAKPEAGIFRRALELADVPARWAVHVGDDAAKDVLGAARVGMRTVWYNPEVKPWPGGQTPDAVIGSLPELEAVLARWTQDKNVEANHFAERISRSS